MTVGSVLLLVAGALLLLDVVLSSLLYRAERKHARRWAADYDAFQRRWNQDRDMLYVTLLKLERSIEQLQKSVTDNAPTATSVPTAAPVTPPSAPFSPFAAALVSDLYAPVTVNGNGLVSAAAPYTSFADVTAARLTRQRRLEETTDVPADAPHPSNA